MHVYSDQVLLVLIVCVTSGSLAYAADQGATPRDSSSPSRSKIYKLEELAWPEIAALDRQRTLFILPVGMIEEHGPHLPVGADTFGVTYETAGASTRVSLSVARLEHRRHASQSITGRAAPTYLGDMLVHPGTDYGIRQSTLRSLVADLGGQIAQNGFKWIFVMNGHGAPTHNIAINEACDFVSETFQVTMLHLTGLFRGDAAIQSSGERITATYFSAAERSSFGMDVHAGVAKHRACSRVRPDLVRSNYKTLPSRAGRSLEELREIATAPGWQGYLSSPASATAAHGRALEACVDRRIHGSDPSCRARGEHVRPCPCPRHGSCRRVRDA